MFNLLPDNLKQELRSEYKFRRLIVTCVFILGLQVLGLIFLFPTWLSSSYRERAIVRQAEQMDQFLATPTANPATGLIKTLNAKLNIVNSALEYPALRPFLDSVISQKTSSISITQFIYATVASSTAELSIGGVSATREALVSFVKKLEDTEKFSKVELPISNLAKDKNIEFTISATIAL